MLDRIKVNIGRTFNMGNFESLRIDAGYETDVKKGEDIDTVFAEAIDLVESQLKGMEQEIRT